MNLPNKWSSDLIGKDKGKAKAAADHIINTPDLEAWQCLIDYSECIFSYIKEKAGNNLVKVINQNNSSNVFMLFKYYAEEWDEYLAIGLAKINSNQITNKVLNLLKNGTQEEKAYAAKYFSKLENRESQEYLFEASKQNFEPLRYNAA